MNKFDDYSENIEVDVKPKEEVKSTRVSKKKETNKSIGTIVAIKEDFIVVDVYGEIVGVKRKTNVKVGDSIIL